jgi:hypothetical protein
LRLGVFLFTEPLAKLPSREPLAKLPSREPLAKLPSREPLAKLPSREPLAKLPSGYRLCQGTTLVVPQVANLDSGFSRRGIANY